ncbi:MAG: sulfatase [Alphaproteobacteria bacterium]|nr:MAG: sulfatase [Alphaproteobacteria bacterium]
MKKMVFGLVVVIVLIGFVGWSHKIDIMLTLVKFKTQRAYDVAPNREITWQAGPALPGDGASERAPNIIFIVLDDVGLNDISSFGGGIADGRLKTPNIDALAAEGMIFNQAYAGNATCAPSRGMMMTGRYPTRTGYEFTPFPGGQGMLATIFNSLDSGLPPAEINEIAEEAALPFDEQGLPSSEVTIAELLKDQGYHTVHIGKWHMGRGQGMAPNDQGFDESLLMHSGLYLPEDDENVVNAKLDFDPIDKFLWARLRYSASFNDAGYDQAFEPRGYLTDYWTEESIKVIKANKNRPFFLYLAHWGLHTPLQATREDYEAVGDIKPHRLRVYAAMMRALDRSIGKIEETLKAEGLAENTMIILTNDNGAPGYIGLPEVNKPYRGWKLTFFEGGIRVPMFVKWPGKIPAGSRAEAPVSHIDLLPTMAAAAGVTLPEGLVIDGVNLLPLARGQAQLPERPIYWQSSFYRGVRLGDWKLQVSEKPAKKWLYDLAADPTERVNLAEKNPKKLAELQGLITAHIASGRGPIYPSTLYAPVMIDKPLNQGYEKGDAFIYWPN